MKTKYVIILLLVLTFGCKTENKKGNEKLIESEETLELKMNNGEKWLVNPETHGGVKKMQSIISAFKNETNKDYKALGKKLSRQTSYIIKNCNMVGEPHDQLHVVLVPMLDEISNIKDAENSTKADMSLVKLEGLINDYFNHFKL